MQVVESMNDLVRVHIESRFKDDVELLDIAVESSYTEPYLVVLPEETLEDVPDKCRDAFAKIFEIRHLEEARVKGKPKWLEQVDVEILEGRVDVRFEEAAQKVKL